MFSLPQVFKLFKTACKIQTSRLSDNFILCFCLSSLNRTHCPFLPIVEPFQTTPSCIYAVSILAEGFGLKGETLYRWDLTFMDITLVFLGRLALCELQHVISQRWLQTPAILSSVMPGSSSRSHELTSFGPEKDLSPFATVHERFECPTPVYWHCRNFRKKRRDSWTKLPRQVRLAKKNLPLLQHPKDSKSKRQSFGTSR